MSGNWYNNGGGGQNSGGGYGGGFNRSKKRSFGGGNGNYSQKRNSFGGGGGGGYDNSQWLRGNDSSSYGGNSNDNYYGNDGYSTSGYGRNNSKQNPFKWYKSSNGNNRGRNNDYSDDYSSNRFGGNDMVSDDFLKEIGRSYLNNYGGSNDYGYYNEGGWGGGNQWGRGYSGSYYGRQFAQKQKKKSSGGGGGSKGGKTKRQETRLEKFKKRQHDKRKFKNLKYLSLNLPEEQSWLVFSVKHFYLDLSRIGEDEDISIANVTITGNDDVTLKQETVEKSGDTKSKELKRRPPSSELTNLKLRAYFFTYLLSKHRHALKILTHETRRLLDATFVDYDDKYNYLIKEKNVLISKYKIMFKRTSTEEDVAKKNSIIDDYIDRIIGDKFDEQNVLTKVDYFIDDAKVNDNFAFGKYYLIKQCYEYFDFKCINVYKPPTSIEQRLTFHMNNKCIPFLVLFKAQNKNERFKLSEQVHGKYVKLLPEHLRKINDKINVIFLERMVKSGEQIALNGKNVLEQKVRTNDAGFEPDKEFVDQFEASIEILNRIMSIVKYKMLTYCFEIDMTDERKLFVLNELVEEMVDQIYYILKNKLKYKDLEFEEMGRLEETVADEKKKQEEPMEQ